MATTNPTQLKHVSPGGLITAELINAIIDALQEEETEEDAPPENWPQIANGYQVDQSGRQAGNDMTFAEGKAASIEGTNLADVWLLRFDSVPLDPTQFQATDSVISVNTVPTVAHKTPGDNYGNQYGLLAITNNAGTAVRIYQWAN